MASDLRTAVRIDVEGSGRFRGEMRRMGRSLDALGGSTRGAARASHAYRQATARAETATRAATGSILTAHAALARYAAAFGAYRLVRTITSFERLRAQMRAVTGDAATAAREFDRLQRFAAQTPFSLQELIRGYVQLSAVSVDASDDVLTSLGNLAAVFGNFGDLVTAVLSRERETFRRFGIDLRQNGDEITVAYRDFATTVENSSPGLVRALAEISDRFFPDGIAERAKTLDGALNNLGDTIDDLADAMGRGGLAAALSGMARDASEFGSAARGMAEALGAVAGAVLTATAAAAPYAAALGAGRVAAAAAAQATARLGRVVRAAHAEEARATLRAAQARRTDATSRIAHLQATRQATAAASADARRAADVELHRARNARQAITAERALGRVRLQTIGQIQRQQARELAAEARVAEATRNSARARRTAERDARRAATATRRYDRVLSGHSRTIAAHNAQLTARARILRGLRGALNLMGGWIGLVTTALTLGSFAWLQWGSAARRAAEDARRALDDQIQGLRAAAGGPVGQIEDLIRQVESRIEVQTDIAERARDAINRSTSSTLATNASGGYVLPTIEVEGGIAQADTAFRDATQRLATLGEYLTFLRADLARVRADAAKIADAGGAAGGTAPADALASIQNRLLDQAAARRGQIAVLVREESKALAELDALKGKPGVDEEARQRARSVTVRLYEARRRDIETRAITKRLARQEQAEEALLAARAEAEDRRARLTLDRIALVDRAERQAVRQARALAAEAIEAADQDVGAVRSIEERREEILTSIAAAATAERGEIRRQAAAAAARERDATHARAEQAEEQRLERRRQRIEAAAEARADVARQLDSGRDSLATPWERATAAIERWEAAARRAVALQHETAVAAAAAGPDAALHCAAAAARADAGYARVTDLSARQRIRAREDEARRSLAASRRWQDGVTRGLRRVREETTNYARIAERVVGGAFQSMADGIEEFVRTGKLSFGGLVESILAGLARIALPRAALGLFDLLPFGGNGLFGIGAGNSHRPPSVDHTGGIIGAPGGVRRTGVPAAAFAGARRLHAGGLASDEVPAILRRGEGVFTPEQMRALGPGGPPEVRIEFTNRGTAQRQAAPANVAWDGRRLVVGVVLEDLEQNGPLSQGLQQRFALPPRV